MDASKELDRLNESSKESAQRQDEVFNRIEEIVKESPEASKLYLQSLTKTSNFELYGRVYGKFAYITLTIAAVVIGLFLVVNKALPASDENLLSELNEMNPTLSVVREGEDSYAVVAKCGDDSNAIKIGKLDAKYLEIINDPTSEARKIVLGDVEFGRFKLENCDAEIKYNQESKGIYILKDSLNYKSKLKDFYFRITEAKIDTSYNNDICNYVVQFGEMKNNKILWTKDTEEVQKSPDAKYSKVFVVEDDRWEKCYVVKMGVGLLGKGNRIYYLNSKAFAFEPLKVQKSIR